MPKKSRIWDFRYFLLGIFGDFLGIYSRFSNSDPDPRDFGIFEIIALGIFSGFFRDFNIPIPTPGISGFFEQAIPKPTLIYNIYGRIEFLKVLYLSIVIFHFSSDTERSLSISSRINFVLP